MLSKINWTVRKNNPTFWIQCILSVVLPIMTYFGLTASDFTTWSMVWDTMWKSIGNPYVIGLVVVGLIKTIIDPTTPGIADGKVALTYEKPGVAADSEAE